MSNISDPQSRYCQFVCQDFRTVPPYGKFQAAYKTPVPWALPMSFQNQGCVARCNSLLDGFAQAPGTIFPTKPYSRPIQNMPATYPNPFGQVPVPTPRNDSISYGEP